MAQVKIYWGWVVCIAFLFIFTLSVGINFSFSEMIIPISRETKSAMSKLTWLGSLSASISMLGAPFATWLYYRIDARILVITGVLMTSLALVLMSLLRDIVTMMAVFGVLAGVGILLVVTPPFFIIDGYFPYKHPRHVLTTSLVACGYPLGTLIFNPLTYALISSIGWRMTYMVYAIAMLVMGLAAAATFRSHTSEELAAELNGNHLSDDRSEVKTNDDVTVEYEPLTSSGDSAVEPASGTEHSTAIHRDDTDEITAASDVDQSSAADGRVKKVSESLDENRSHSTEGELGEICESTPLKSDERELATGPAVFVGIIWFLANCFKCTGYYTPIFILVKQMEIMKIPQGPASRAMALIGSCELVSRLVTSYLGDRFKGNILIVYVICSLLLCLENGLGSLATTYTHILIYSAALGVLGGPIIAAMYSSCSEVLQGQYVHELFTTFRIAVGIGSIVGPTIAGVIYDHTGSFRDVFYVNCISYALASLLYALIFVINRQRPAWMFKRDIQTDFRNYSTVKDSS